MKFLLTNEVARILKRTPDTVRAMERRGELRATRVGHIRLFKQREVERLAQARAQQQKPEQKESPRPRGGRDWH